MSTHDKLRELKQWLEHSLEVVNSLLAFIHFDEPDSTSSSSTEGESSSEELLLPSPPPAVRGTRWGDEADDDQYYLPPPPQLVRGETVCPVIDLDETPAPSPRAECKSPLPPGTYRKTAWG